jgi:hypothetical protein
MRKIASVGFAIGALTITALPVHAEDQSLYFATGAIGGGGPARAYDQQAQARSRQYSAYRRVAPPQMSTEAYRSYAYRGYGYGVDDLHGGFDHGYGRGDVWGHWGGYYGPMVR